MAAKGYNVTTISADIETTVPDNLHCIHLDKVYEYIHDPDGGDLNYVEFGDANPWMKLWMMSDITLKMCEGIIMSNGWKQLYGYPDSFKVKQ